MIFIYLLNRYFGYFNTIEIKGKITVGENLTLCGLYISTVLGILGHHIFIQIKGLNSRGKQPKLKWVPLLKPLAISPIIFMAVLNQLNKMGTQANTLTAVITQFILAFQNGFFWREVFENAKTKIQ